MSAPADAHVSTGWAVGAGLLGIGLGAAIASDHPHRYPDYGYGYDAPPPPFPAPMYYAPPPPLPRYGYENVQRCRVTERWDPYWGEYRQSRRCY